MTGWKPMSSNPSVLPFPSLPFSSLPFPLSSSQRCLSLYDNQCAFVVDLIGPWCRIGTGQMLLVEPRWGSHVIGIPIPGCVSRPWTVLLDCFAVTERFTPKVFNNKAWGRAAHPRWRPAIIRRPQRGRTIDRRYQRTMVVLGLHALNRANLGGVQE